MVSSGVERVVDGVAILRAQAHIVADHGVAASIGEGEIVAKLQAVLASIIQHCTPGRINVGTERSARNSNERQGNKRRCEQRPYELAI